MATDLIASTDDLSQLLRRLADRERVRSEATVQADVRQLLLTGGLGLGDHDLDVQLETQVGDRRRIDVEVGFTVIEVKKDLRNQGIVRAAEEQLAGYVAARAAQTGQRYVGVLTDGREWRAYHERDGKLVGVTQHVVNPTRPDGIVLLFWLEGVLASRQGVPPTPNEIKARLGATSASYALDRATLAALYADHSASETVRLKRQLWSRLLRSALGTQFTDDDELFLEHTLLVNSAEIIAHLVVGLDVIDMQPASLLGGQRFDLAAIYGVVERDFFDWILEVPHGGDFVRTLARRLSRSRGSPRARTSCRAFYSWSRPNSLVRSGLPRAASAFDPHAAVPRRCPGRNCAHSKASSRRVHPAYPARREHPAVPCALRQTGSASTGGN